MKKIFVSLGIALLLAGSALSTSSCNRKSGCKINDNAQVKTNKKGDFKRSKTKSGLFPKKMKRG